ncbi:MAG: RNA polymerase sigma factor [Planctomycetes bacterium]|nr:RNA polymerase sigma factor [Planctomycetota bacterium]
MRSGRGGQGKERSTDDFASLYERYAGRAFRYARMMGLCESDADDVVAESFLKAMRARASFRAEADLSTWLLTIVRNTTLNLLRSEGRRLARLERLAGRKQAQPAPDLPLEQLERREMLGAVETVMRKLTREQRSALSLVTTGGLSYRQAAQVEGVAEAALTSRIYRARQSLRQYLTEMGMLEAE